MNNTSIEWCDRVWNPWRENGAERRLSSVRVWRDPFRWAKRSASRPQRVFALSMGDFLDGGPRAWPLVGQPQGGIPAGWMARMLDTIRLTPELHYILVTKRPENFFQRIQDVRYAAESATNFELIQWATRWAHGEPPRNVCIMASVEDQQRADERIPHLLRIPARWHGLSLEPLLGPVALWLGAIKLQRPERFWLIPGGESGHGARPCDVAWIRNIRDQGEIAGCPVFVKQLGSRPFDSSQSSDRLKRFSVKGTWKDGVFWPELKHPKGADPEEWHKEFRVREFPEGL